MTSLITDTVILNSSTTTLRIKPSGVHLGTTQHIPTPLLTSFSTLPSSPRTLCIRYTTLSTPAPCCGGCTVFCCCAPSPLPTPPYSDFDPAKLVYASHSLLLTASSPSTAASVCQIGRSLLHPPTKSGADGRRTGLVVVNPVSGKGEGEETYRNVIGPVVSSMGLDEVIVHTTESAGDGGRWIASLDSNTLHDAAFVAVVGGDGSLHEILQGLATRDDAQWVFNHVPLVPVPSGSGDGLALSLGITSPHAAAHVLARGLHKRIDLASVWSPDTPNAPLLSFLSLEWGLLADVDIESEKWRWMGDARFTVYGLQRCVFIRKYVGRLLFIPAPDQDLTSTSVFCTSQPTCPGCRPRPDSHSESNADASTTESETETETETENSLQQEEEDEDYFPSSSSSSSSSSSPPTPNIPPPSPAAQRLRDIVAGAALDEDLTDVEVREGSFVMVLSTNTPTITTDMVFSPQAHLADGTLDLTLVQEASRTGLVSIMTKLEDGSYLDGADNIEQVKVLAFALEPGPREDDENRPGKVVIDGELVPYTPVVVEAHHAHLLTLVPNLPSLIDATVSFPQ